MQDHDYVGIEENMLRLRKMLGTYKDFGKIFYELWADVLHYYITILVSLFDKETPDFHAALADFYSCIYEFLIVYDWQEAVFSMAIKAHIFIVA